MAETKVLNCSCKHKYQDEKFGKGKRLHNAMMKPGYYRCTVCGEVHTK